MWGCSALPSPSWPVPGHFCTSPSQPPPAHGSGPAPRTTRVGLGLSPSPCRVPAPGKVSVYFMYVVPPGLCRQGDRGSPGSIGTRDVPADFLTVAGGADMEMSSLRGSGGRLGRPRPGTARPGPARWSRGCGTRCPLEGIRGKWRSFIPGTVNPWHAEGPRLPVGRALATPAPCCAPSAPALPRAALRGLGALPAR